MAHTFIKKPPLRLSLEDYDLIIQLIDEAVMNEPTLEERELKLKIQQIAFNIKRAIEFNKRRNQNDQAS